MVRYVTFSIFLVKFKDFLMHNNIVWWGVDKTVTKKPAKAQLQRDRTRLWPMISRFRECSSWILDPLTTHWHPPGTIKWAHDPKVLGGLSCTPDQWTIFTSPGPWLSLMGQSIQAAFLHLLPNPFGGSSPLQLDRPSPPSVFLHLFSEINLRPYHYYHYCRSEFFYCIVEK